MNLISFVLYYAITFIFFMSVMARVLSRELQNEPEKFKEAEEWLLIFSVLLAAVALIDISTSVFCGIFVGAEVMNIVLILGVIWVLCLIDIAGFSIHPRVSVNKHPVTAQVSFMAWPARDYVSKQETFDGTSGRVLGRLVDVWSDPVGDVCIYTIWRINNDKMDLYSNSSLLYDVNDAGKIIYAEIEHDPSTDKYQMFDTGVLYERIPRSAKRKKV